MRDGTSSWTAAWVATFRGLGMLLPDDVRIADDPFGTRFGGPLSQGALALGRRSPHLARGVTTAIAPWIAYMQVRTRAIDDVVLEFVAGGGRQIVLLGAGFDCRAARFPSELGDARVFEVDHPATQARKRAAMAGVPSAPVTYVAWDFEARPMAELPDALAAQGLDPSRPTVVVWEGVTMYLTEGAIEASLAAIRRFGAPGSPLVLNYFDRAKLFAPRGARRAVAKLVSTVGEPFRFGWDPATLGDWLATRGFRLARDQREVELAALLLPTWNHVHSHGSHIAVAHTT